MPVTGCDPPAGLGRHGPDGRADYTLSLALPRSGADDRSAEEWARAVFESPPSVLRWTLVAGWTTFGFRPRASSATHVLSWAIQESSSGTLVMAQQSRLMAAQNVVSVDRNGVTWSTFVAYRSPVGALLWSIAAPIHERLTPLLLRRAAARL
jgi:hypothetical protein